MISTIIWFIVGSALIIFSNTNEKNSCVLCTTLSQNVFGKCVRILHLFEEGEPSQKLEGLGPFHRYIYVTLRQTLEQVAFFASRCLLACTPVVFSLSLLHLVLPVSYESSTPVSLHAGACRNEQAETRIGSCLKSGFDPRGKEGKSVPASKQKTISEVTVEDKKKLPRKSRRRGYIISMILLLLTSATILSVVVPFSYELYYGGALSYQLSSFNTIVTKREWIPWPFKTIKYLRTAFIGEKECSSGFDLFDFQCLRNNLFDLDASGIKQAMSTVPETLHEKLCLQIHISNLNCTAAFVSLLLYASCILFFFLVFKVLRKLLSSISNPSLEHTSPKMRSPVDKNRGRPLRQPKHHTVGEYCEKKQLKVGGVTPWREVKFSSDVQPTDRSREKGKGILQKSLSTISRKKTSNRLTTEDSNRDFLISKPELPSSAVTDIPRGIPRDVPIDQKTPDINSSESHSSRPKDASQHEYQTNKPSSVIDNAKLAMYNIKVRTPPTRDTNSSPTSSRYLLEPVEVRKPMDVMSAMRGTYSGPESTNIQRIANMMPPTNPGTFSRVEPVEVKCSSKDEPIKFRQLTVPRTKTPSPIKYRSQTPVACFGTANDCGKVQSRMAKKNGVSMLKYLGRNIKEYY